MIIDKEWVSTHCHGDERQIIIPSEATEIAGFSFENFESLRSVAIPEGMKRISRRAFGGCKSLEKVIVPDSVTKIGIEAFGDCSSLKEIQLSENLTAIRSHAFAHCNSLKRIELPDSLIEMDMYALSWCDAVSTYKNQSFRNIAIYGEEQQVIDFINDTRYKNLDFFKSSISKAYFALKNINSNDKYFARFAKEKVYDLFYYAVTCNDIEVIDDIIDNKLLDSAQLEKCMDYSIGRSCREIYAMLVQYKNATKKYKRENERFDL